MHVTARGNERRQIFVDDKDRRHFLELLEATVGSTNREAVQVGLGSYLSIIHCPNR
jgi:hypothetical protein